MRNLILIISLSLLLSNCIYSQKPHPDSKTEKIDKGILENNIYSNKYFNFEVPILKDWTVLNKSDLLNATIEKKEILKAEKNITEEDFIRMADKFYVLLSSSPNIQTQLPLIVFYTLDLDLDLTNYSEIDYLDNYRSSIKNLYKSISVEFSFSQIQIESIRDKSFYSYEITVKRDGLFAYQKVYSTIYRNKFLNILVNYENEKTKSESQEFLKNIIWKE